MKNTEPNKIVSALHKRYVKLAASYIPNAENKEYWIQLEQIKSELRDIASVVGAISVMSKNNIIKLVALQSSLRFMAEHRFYALFSRAAEDLKINN